MLDGWMDGCWTNRWTAGWMMAAGQPDGRTDGSMGEPDGAGFLFPVSWYGNPWKWAGRLHTDQQ